MEPLKVISIKCSHHFYFNDHSIHRFTSSFHEKIGRAKLVLRVLYIVILVVETVEEIRLG